MQPRAGRNELVGPEDKHLKVRITAPPVDGKANAHLRRFLAQELGVPQTRVELLAGAGARNKRVRIRAPRKLPVGIRKE